MKDLKKFLFYLKQLKANYDSWQANFDDPAIVVVWFDWFDSNTTMDENEFGQLVKAYAREKIYAPHSPRELFEVYFEMNRREHTPIAVIWREAMKAFRNNEKQNDAYYNWVKVDCGKDADAMEFLMSKELLVLLNEWIRMSDNEYVDRTIGQKVEQEWNRFLWQKITKNPKQDDGTLELEDISDKLRLE